MKYFAWHFALALIWGDKVKNMCFGPAYCLSLHILCTKICSKNPNLKCGVFRFNFMIIHSSEFKESPGKSEKLYMKFDQFILA